jgi:hypothetical protein
MWIGAIIIIGILLLLAMAGAGPDLGGDGRDHTLDWNRRNGQYRVLYPDGEVSQTFTWEVARDYREIFGGKVVPR